jgi:cell filamentation protein
LFGIADEDSLLFAESGAVAKRLQELYENPIKPISICSLLDIHRHLLQDIYDWAGKVRIVEISKGGKQFFPISHFENAFLYINTLISEYKGMEKTNKYDLAHKLSEILDNVNFLYPFREGNGRAQCEFMRSLALEKGLILNLNPPNNTDVYKRYMYGTINSDVETLTELTLN